MEICPGNINKAKCLLDAACANEPMRRLEFCPEYLYETYLVIVNNVARGYITNFRQTDLPGTHLSCSLGETPSTWKKCNKCVIDEIVLTVKLNVGSTYITMAKS